MLTSNWNRALLRVRGKLKGVGEKTPLKRQTRQSKQATDSNALNVFNSVIASVVPSYTFACVALACSSSGELWLFECSPSGICRRKVYENIVNFSHEGGDWSKLVSNKGYLRSLTWRFPHHSTKESNRQFLVLTNCEIQCFRVVFSFDMLVSRPWSQEIVGTDAELGIKKYLAVQKGIWPLDVQVDDHGKVITVLVATFCKDRISSSSYMQYSLLTMPYKSGYDVESTNERIL